MIIGSGLLALAFSPTFATRPDICIYAAGVSNSSCNDPAEFERERVRLTEALRQNTAADVFVYFSTCSILDPESAQMPYVQHKLAMEDLVARHPGHLVLRLPQVVGKTPNPHTLLNFLHARISRSESFPLWIKARRNIIDVADVAAIGTCLIQDRTLRNETLNLAAPTSYALPDIVRALENCVGKHAIYKPLDRGGEYPIDIQAIQPALAASGVKFGPNYLERVIEKYYGHPH